MDYKGGGRVKISLVHQLYAIGSSSSNKCKLQKIPCDKNIYILSFNMLTNCITAGDDVSVEIWVLLFWLLGQMVGPEVGPKRNW